MFNKLGHNANSGVWINAGVGFLMHKIRVETQEDQVVNFRVRVREARYARLFASLAPRRRFAPPFLETPNGGCRRCPFSPA